MLVVTAPITIIGNWLNFGQYFVLVNSHSSNYCLSFITTIIYTLSFNVDFIFYYAFNINFKNAFKQFLSNLFKCC